jgi:DNA replication protein DnaC
VPALVEDRVRLSLERLKLDRISDVLGRALEEAGGSQVSYLDFLDQLLQEELSARFERNVAIKTKLAHLPYHKTMNDFDYSFQPSLDKKQIADLLTLRFVESASNVLLLGPPGVGKSHIAVALALEAITKGYTAYFVTLQHLIDYLSEGLQGHESVSAKMTTFLRPRLLVIDEVGYLPLDRQAANWFFELVSRRYERGSIVLTSNKSYGDWASLFPEVAIASAILDRLLHHSVTISIRGESYRLKDKRRAGLLQRPDSA